MFMWSSENALTDTESAYHHKELHERNLLSGSKKKTVQGYVQFIMAKSKFLYRYFIILK